MNSLGCRVLLVDDEDVLLRALERTLDRRLPGIECVAVTNSEDALRAAQRPLDLAIVDIDLGGISGLDLVRALRAQKPSLQIAVMSGTEQTQFDEAKAAGAAMCLEKPFTAQRLVSLVELALLSQETRIAERPLLEGRVEGFQVAEIVQLACASRLSARIDFSSDEGPDGTLAVRDGRLVFASTIAHGGEQAVGELLKLRSGSFRAVPDATEIEPNLNATWNEILMHCADLEDEARDRAEQVSGDAAPTTQRLGRLRLAEASTPPELATRGDLTRAIHRMLLSGQAHLNLRVIAALWLRSVRHVGASELAIDPTRVEGLTLSREHDPTERDLLSATRACVAEFCRLLLPSAPALVDRLRFIDNEGIRALMPRPSGLLPRRAG